MQPKTQCRRWIATALVMSLSLLGSIGCAKTHEARLDTITYSGFLNDYAELKHVKGSPLLEIYVKPGLDLSSYDKVLLDPPQLWISAKTRDRVKPEELDNLVAQFATIGRSQVERDWAVTDTPGPGVLRIRTAITEANAATPVLHTVVAVVPQARLISEAVRLSTGAALFVGSAQVEAEVLDSVTGQRLGAAVDRRVGANVLSASLSDWGNVKDAFRFWARRLTTDLQTYGMKPTKTDKKS